MAINYIWTSLIVISFLVASVKLILFGDTEVWNKMLQSLFDSSKDAFSFALNLTGVLTLFLGLLKVAEKAGMVQLLAKLMNPFFSRIFPGIPKGHPSTVHILMNFSANMLGLDNAATPLGLKAMQSLQELNPDKEKASNAQIMFLTLNASGLTIIPISIISARAAKGAANPADVFIPILIATYCSSLAGLLAVSIYQKINLLNKIVFTYLLATSSLVGLAIFYFSNLSTEQLNTQSSLFSSIILFSIIVLFIVLGVIKKINVYDAFIEGAKEGFESAIKIIAYMVAIFVAISMFRSCGAMDIIMNALKFILLSVSADVRFVDALPTALMKPLSGTGARGMMLDAMQTYGADSFTARLSCIFQGAADTTFYILSVYLGYVGIKNSRYALATCLIADLAGVIAAVCVTYIFF
ncbi:MAG: hypothetical protein NZ529_00175 [Cytophagaceae bacterium]|nr:hypothetical protein [Cytophagaceae bacterium]MDW8455180.1 nucleoside recognition domain-containing protein [Cytophagaceae bacterium]